MLRLPLIQPDKAKAATIPVDLAGAYSRCQHEHSTYAHAVRRPFVFHIHIRLLATFSRHDRSPVAYGDPATSTPLIPPSSPHGRKNAFTSKIGKLYTVQISDQITVQASMSGSEDRKTLRSSMMMLHG